MCAALWTCGEDSSKQPVIEIESTAARHAGLAAARLFRVYSMKIRSC